MKIVIEHVKGTDYTLIVNDEVVYKATSLAKCKARVKLLMD